MFVSPMRELISMNNTVRENHNFKTIKSYIPKSCYFSNFVSYFVYQTALGLEPILLNDIIGTFKLVFSFYNDRGCDIHVKNNDTNETWAWSE